MKRKYICEQCGKLYLAYECHAKRSKHHYCGYLCVQIASRKKPSIFYKGIRFTYQKNRHKTYLLSTDGKQTRLHNLLWQEKYGPIPNGYLVHHIDGNGLNNNLTNLTLKEWGIHTGEHNLGQSRKQPPKPCMVQDCNRRSKAKNLCTMHYQRMKARERGYWL